MVLSINEEIAALEEQLSLVKGQGSAAKKKSIQAKINKLREEGVPEEVISDEESIQDVGSAEVQEESVIPVGWKKVTVVQVLLAEKQGTLVGYDPDSGMALIK